MTFSPITTNDLELNIYDVGFTRVTGLLNNPVDVRAAAQSFVEEITQDWEDSLYFKPVVINIKPLFPGDEKLEEVEYQLTVLMSAFDVRYLEEQGAPYSINLTEYTR